MKKTLISAVICLATFTVIAQEETSPANSSETTYEQCKSFVKTPPLREMLEYLEPVDDYAFSMEAGSKPMNPMRHADLSEVSSVMEPDGAMQDAHGTNEKGGFRLALNFDGQYGAFPPDPSGAVGPNYYVQAVNSSWRIWDKTGDPETPPYSLNTLWDRPGSGDPIIMYDRFAERWFISQFYGSPGGGDVGVLIAVSETSDPLGAYYAYEYDFTLFPDYPKFSVWSNAYYMSANSSSADCCAFDRQKMLIGDPTAGVIKMSFPPIYQLFNSVAPAYAEGPEEPDMDEPCYFFAVQDNGYPGVSSDHILVLKAEIDWDSPGSSSITEHQEISTASFNANLSGGWTENVAQKGTLQRLDGIPGIFMYRAQYRRFGDYNTIVLCHNVSVGAYKVGQRWYELRDNDDGNWEMHQQSTYSPDTDVSRWLGNLSMDAQGNIAMAYSYTGSDDYPGLRYTGRFWDDPLNVMTVPELTAVEGEGAQTAAGRYGDYSQMSMDPTDDMTFWFTGEYLGAGGARKTRIFSFSSWHIAGTEEHHKAVPQFNAYQPNTSELKLTWNDLAQESIMINVVDISGRHILQTPLNNGTTEQIVEIPGAASGIFIVTLSGETTNLSQKIYIGR
ncbi:MAG: T9SS type A sorting domain-containing protein [Crocinitomix sp.]|nr:T9SS type A sorting domain-containing protein [Crocinitomix sp.]